MDLPKNITSRKLFWLLCLVFDRELTPLDKSVALIIMTHVNNKTGKAWPSEELIGDLVGGYDRRHISRSIRRLGKRGWLIIKRKWVVDNTGRRTMNVYELGAGPLSKAKEARDAAIEAHKTKRKHRSQGEPSRSTLGDQCDISVQTPPDQCDIFDPFSAHRCHTNHLREPSQIEPSQRVSRADARSTPQEEAFDEHCLKHYGKSYSEMLAAHRAKDND